MEETNTCRCFMDEVLPQTHDTRDFIEAFAGHLCERCGNYISFEKYEAYKRSHGVSGYDEASDMDDFDNYWKEEQDYE